MKQLLNQLLTKLPGIFILSICCGALSVRADDLVVLKGTASKIDVAQGVKRVDIGNPTVIDATPASDGLSVTINGVGEGESQLRIETLQGTDITTNVVVRADLNQVLSEVQSLLSDVEGLNASIVGNKVVLQGNILTSADADKVSRVASIYGNAVVNLTIVDHSQMNKYVEQAIVKDIGIDTVNARVMGDTVVLDGVVYDQNDLKRAEELAKLRVPKVVNLIKVEDVMIETDLEFVDLSTSHSFNWGYDVLDSVSASVGSGMSGNGATHIQPGGTPVPVPGTSNIITTITGGFPITYGVTASANAQAQITADLGNGSGKVVAQPHISTKSGEMGNFQDGFTSYYQEPGAVGGPASLTSVQYGVLVTVNPTLEGEHKIMNTVSLNISEPIATAAGAVLSLDTYDTKCTALCNEGESMVISGMVQTGSNNSKNGAPLLRDIPLLDLFFANRSTSKTRDEFVILVTPQAVLPTVAPGTPFSEQHSALFQDQNNKE